MSTSKPITITTTQPTEPLETQSETWRPLSEQPGTILLPSDPKIKLTKEQIDALFAGDRQGFIRELKRIVQKHRACDAGKDENTARQYF